MSLGDAKLDSVLECPICREVLTDPKTLPCLHIYCLKCLKQYGETTGRLDTLPCPVCMSEFQLPAGGFDDLQKPFIVEKLLEVRRQSEQCEEHPTRLLQAYCETCGFPTCLQCHMIGEDHEGHRFRELEKIANEARDTLREDVKRVHRSISEAIRVSGELDDKLRTLNGSLLVAEAEVLRLKEKVKENVDRHAELLLRELDNIRAQKVEQKEKLRERFQRHLEQLEDLGRRGSDAVSFQTPGLLLRSVKDLKKEEEVLNKVDVEEWLKEFQLVELTIAPAHLQAYASDRLSLIGRLVVTPETDPDNPYPFISKTLKEIVCRKRFQGVTVLDEEIFIIHEDPTATIDVFDLQTVTWKTSFSIPNIRSPKDITSCQTNQCLYVSDYSVNRVVHRIQLPQRSFTNWPMNEFPSGLSVTMETHLLVACPDSNKVVEFTTDGVKVREVTLPDHVKHPLHVLQLPTGHLLVCHGIVGCATHGVSKLDPEGRQVVARYGGAPGTGAKQLNTPTRVAVERNGHLLVCDHFNNRLLMLSPSLERARSLSDGEMQNPRSFVVCEHLLLVVESNALGRLIVYEMNGGGGKREQVPSQRSVSKHSSLDRKDSSVE